MLILILCLSYLYKNRNEALMPEKRIALIFSFKPTYVGQKGMKEIIEKNLREKGYKPNTKEMFLDCEKYNEINEIKQVGIILDKLKAFHPDLIIVQNDQAAYSLLSSNHSLLSKCPTILTNVHFPNKELLLKNQDKPIYCLCDSPDFTKNVEFMESIYKRHLSLDVFINYSPNALGRISLRALLQQTENSPYHIKCIDYPVLDWGKGDWGHVQAEIDTFKLKHKRVYQPIVTSYEIFPIQMLGGYDVIHNFIENKQVGRSRSLLIDKMDMSLAFISSFFPDPVFTCIKEGFGENCGITGGYFASDRLTGEYIANVADCIFRDSPPKQKIIDLPKEYLIDLDQAKRYDNLDLSKLSKEVRIINNPWYIEHHKELIFFGSILFIAIASIFTNWIQQLKRGGRQKMQLKALEDLQTKLALSIRSSRTAIWTYQNNQFIFDDDTLQIIPQAQKVMTADMLNTLIHPADKKAFHDMAQTLAHSHKSTDSNTHICQTRILYKDSTKYIWIEWRYSNTIVNGTIISCGLLQDIEQTKKREYELIKAKELAEQAEMKQSFLANMSHEIRTPLNAIVGFSNLIADPENNFSDEEKSNFIDIIRRNNDILLKLINDVLELSRMESGNLSFRFEEIPAEKIVNEIYQTHRVIINKNLEFKFEMPKDHKSEMIKIDRIRLTQVITNFLSNSNKFTTEGYIKLSLTYDDSLHEAIISVEDSGKGISEDELKLIFDRFYKSDEFEQGTGLGLSISQVIIKKMNGRIEVTSKLGKGSKFSVILPLISNC